MRNALIAASLSALLVCPPAFACGDPTDEWYRDASDVVFDGLASCLSDERSCSIRVNRVLKNPMNLSLGSQRIQVDYQNWFADYSRDNPDSIIITCGVPVFEPELSRFRGRFFANLDRETGELVVRTHRIWARDRRLWRESDCELVDGEIVCEEGR